MTPEEEALLVETATDILTYREMHCVSLTALADLTKKVRQLTARLHALVEENRRLHALTQTQAADLRRYRS